MIYPQNSPTPYSQPIVSFYVANLGQRETSPNRGPLPDRVYRYIVGGDPEDAPEADRQYCCGTYCLACLKAGVPNPPKTMSSGGLYDHCKEYGRIVYVPRAFTHNGRPVKACGDASNARPGDALLELDSTNTTGVCHTGCLKEYLGNNRWATIEANLHNAVSPNERDVWGIVIVRPFK